MMDVISTIMVHCNMALMIPGSIFSYFAASFNNLGITSRNEYFNTLIHYVQEELKLDECRHTYYSFKSRNITVSGAY